MFHTLNSLSINVYNDIQEFFYSNNLLLTACGYTVGFTTYHYISSTLQLFVPITAYFGNYIINKDLSFIGIHKTNIIYKILIKIVEILSNTFIWLFTLFLTFVLLEYVLYNKILGLKTTIKDSDKTNYVVAKTIAKKEQREAIDEKAEKVKIKQQSDNIIGEKMIKKQEKINEKIVKDPFIDEKDIKPLLEDFHNFGSIITRII